MRRLKSIQSARALAALLVFISHFGPKLNLDLSAFVVGVDVFFIVSGFVMVYIAKEHQGRPLRFLALRALRIYPLYWLFLFATSPVATVFAGAYRLGGVDDVYYVKSFFLWPVFNPTYGALVPYFTLGWTLMYELVFYLLFAVLLMGSLRHLAAKIAAALLACYLAHFLMPAGIAAALFGNTVILEFALGAALAECFLARRTVALKVCTVLGLAMAVYLFTASPATTDATRIIFYGLPATGAVAGLLLTNRVPRLVVALGDASYATYLIHAAVAGTVWTLLADKVGRLPAMLSAIIVTLAVAYLVHIALERPLLRISRRLVDLAARTRRRSVPASALPDR